MLRDFTMCRGFNPNIRMERTKILMQGHDCCNHRWILEV
ncbi:MAG: L-2-amino-thiazoline-4-carboxylic acid hydrolase [Gemmatimonadota bacterium]|nr:MAG: L-2-amino-thiazoline-4-carboxylic acid hydrolase [Gemmatimonadota bacterium]